MMQKGWTSLPLSTIARAPIVYGIVQPGEQVAAGVPFVQTRDIGGPLELNRLDRTSPAIAAKYNRSSLQAGDLILSLRGDIGASSTTPDSLDGANISRGVARVRVSTDHDPRFIHYALDGSQVRRSISAASRGSTLREISIASLREIHVTVPPLPEQRRISEILRTWDDAIERTQTLVDATREIKRSLVRRALADSPETRNVPLDHVVRPLTAKNSLGETRVLTSSAIHGLVSQSDYFSKSVAGSDISGYYLLHRGDFAYNRSSSNGFPYGAIRRLDEHERGVISTLYLCFTPIAPKLADTDYLAHSFASGVLDPQLALICHEGARSHGLLNVSRADFFELVIPLPSVERQHFIAAALDEADAEITLLNRNLELLRTQKRGLMQKLLTGEVRVQLNAKQKDSADV